MKAQAIEALNNDPWLLGIPAPARNELIAAARIKRFEENHVLYRRDDEACDLMYVVSGRVRAGAIMQSGEELMFTSMLAGEWFGEISILDGLGRTHGVTTVEKSVLALIDKGTIAKLSERYPEIHQALVALLCAHFRMALMLIDTFLLFTPEERLATRLLKTSESLRLTSPAEIKVNQEELSKLVGVSRQSINKILKAWEKSGWISLAYSSIIIHDLAKLGKLVQK